METKYLINGDAVAVLEKLQSGYLVANMYTGGDNESGPVDYIDDEHPYLVKQLYDEVPVQKKNEVIEKLEQQIADKNKELLEINKKVREANEAEKSAIEKWSKYEQIKQLHLYIDGKITHYVLEQYGNVNIVEVGSTESEFSRDQKGQAKLKLLSLFGSAVGDMQWKINQYSDGSSGSWYNVWPCTSYEEAQEKVGPVITEELNKYAAGTRGYIDGIMTSARKFGIEIPEAVETKYREEKMKGLQSAVDNHKKNLESAEKQLEELKSQSNNN